MNNLNDFCMAAAECKKGDEEEEQEELEQEEESMEEGEEIIVKMEGVKEDNEDDDIGCHGMKDLGFQCIDSKEALASNQSPVDIMFNMKVEVFPKKTNWKQVTAEMEATESDDAIRNFDVLIRPALATPSYKSRQCKTRKGKAN